jgi:hypothetical protein
LCLDDGCLANYALFQIAVDLFKLSQLHIGTVSEKVSDRNIASDAKYASGGSEVSHILRIQSLILKSFAVVNGNIFSE